MRTNVIAVSGKGGTGKTAVAAALTLGLRDALQRPVLAVDADPNSTLGELLGLEYDTTLADIRERKATPDGVPLPDAVAFGIEQALVEGEGCDLLVMGRPEGPGCYCAVNHLLRTTLSHLVQRYAAVVVDNEAGMEHLSRRSSGDVAALLVVAGPDHVSLRAARRILDLAGAQGLKVHRTVLVQNRWPEAPSPGIVSIAESAPVQARVVLPYSAEIERIYCLGESFLSLSGQNEFLRAVNGRLLPQLAPLLGEDSAP